MKASLFGFLFFAASIVSSSFANQACVHIDCTSEIAESLISSVEIWIDNIYHGSREVYCNRDNHVDKIGSKEKICDDVPGDQITKFGIKVTSESVDFGSEETSGDISMYEGEKVTFHYDPQKDPQDPENGLTTGEILAIGVGSSRGATGSNAFASATIRAVLADPEFWNDIFGTDNPVAVDRLSEIYEGTLFKPGYGDKMSFFVSVEPSIVLTLPSTPIPGTITRERWVTNHSSQNWRFYARPSTVFINGIKGGSLTSGLVGSNNQGYIVWDIKPAETLVILYRVDYVPLNDVDKIIGLQDSAGGIKTFWWEPLGTSEATIVGIVVAVDALQLNHPANGDIQIVGNTF